MKLLIVTLAFLIAGFGGCNNSWAASVGQAMNVSGSGSNYIFVYRGNNPAEFDALVAQGLNNLVGWSANCVSQGCTTAVLIISQAVLATSDYLYLYTTTALPDSGQWYSFNSPAPPPPALCCGGSSAQFNADNNAVTQVQNFFARASQDSQVYVSQIGDANNITVNQTGAKNNYVYYSSVGSNNNVAVSQTGDNNTQANYSRTTVTGNSNTVAVTQTSIGGAKGAFVAVGDNNNNLTLSQTGSGSHYAEVNLTGNNKTVDIAQSGNASHVASVALSGLPSSLSLQQTGSTQQFYSIQFNCATAGGCSPILVRQGN